jgi:hypothetical protein
MPHDEGRMTETCCGSKIGRGEDYCVDGPIIALLIKIIHVYAWEFCAYFRQPICFLVSVDACIL